MPIFIRFQDIFNVIKHILDNDFYLKGVSDFDLTNYFSLHLKKNASLIGCIHLDIKVHNIAFQFLIRECVHIIINEVFILIIKLLFSILTHF